MPKNKPEKIVLLVLMITVAKAWAGDIRQPLLSGHELETLIEIVKKEVADQNIVDLDFLLVHHNAVALNIHIRDGELLENERQPLSLVRIASMTKPITAAAALLLVERGDLDLKTPLSRYLPEFSATPVWSTASAGEYEGNAPLPTVASRTPILIEHLLTHTSGLTYAHEGDTPLTRQYRRERITNGAIQTPDTLSELVTRLARIPLKNHPGEAFEYGMSSDVLGRVIEVVSGQPLDEFLEENIFKPLGMVNTHFFISKSDAQRLLPLYSRDADGRFFELPPGPQRVDTLEFSVDYPYAGPRKYFSGGGGLVSTADDYMRFLLSLARFSGYDGPSVIGPKMTELMTSDQLPNIDIGIPGLSYGYGFGIRISENQGSTLGEVGEYSWGGIFFTNFWVDPENEIIGVFMSQIQMDKRTDFYKRLKNSVYRLNDAIIDEKNE